MRRKCVCQEGRECSSFRGEAEVSDACVLLLKLVRAKRWHFYHREKLLVTL